MRVTVITAFHNCERYLRATVESVARQTLMPEEHLLVNDASTDGSAALAEQLSVEYTHVRVMRHASNQGYPAALNTGIAAAISDFVAILDGDDIALPDWLESVMPVITADPQIGAVGGGCIIMTQHGHITSYEWLCHTEGDVTDRIRNGEYHILHPGTVFRRSSLQAIGGYHHQLVGFEDYDLFVGLSTVARLIHIGKPLIYYRRLPQSQSRKTPEYQKLANDFSTCKLELLKQGMTVAEANRLLAAKVSALQAVPRRGSQKKGGYYFEMAQAFERGRRRWMAAAWYLAALLRGSHLRSSIRGIGRSFLG